LEGKTDVNDGKWHYIVGVYDGSKKYLYVDGKLDASASASDISVTKDPVEIGANNGGRNFNGLIDEVRIWNVARTATDIVNNMNIVLTGKENGLVAYYKFDDSSGTWLYDYTKHGNTGKLHNMNNSNWVPSRWGAAPKVNTTEVSNVDGTTAEVSGRIISEETSPVTAKGVVWGTTNNPTLQDHLGITDEGGDTTSFISKLTGLSDTTVYYARAYATNNIGTGYGEVKSFTIMSPPPTMIPPGNALKFDGTGYVTLPNNSNFDFTHAMTVAAWIKITNPKPYFSDRSRLSIVTKGNKSWKLERTELTSTVDFDTRDIYGYEHFLGGKTNVSDGKWHYVVGVIDGSKKYLYVDGKLDAEGYSDKILNTAAPVEIGANSVGFYAFNGLIDEVRIWNVARTATEIVHNMHKELTGKEKGLVAYYKFDNSSGTWLYDYTGHDNVGKLHNMNNSNWVASGWRAVPKVNTTEISNVGATTADVSGRISSEGASPIMAKGVVWDTTNNPTLQDHLGISDEGGDTTSFTSKLSGLSDTTVYYARAYATNNSGTAYGAAKLFTTMSPPPTMVPPGNALKFDGTGYVVLSHTSNFDFTHAMTVAAWIKVNAFTKDWQAIVTKGGGSWRLQRYGSTNHIDFGVKIGLNISYDLYLYVDGKLDASRSYPGNISITNSRVEIGANNDGSNFDGLIDGTNRQ